MAGAWASNGFADTWCNDIIRVSLSNHIQERPLMEVLLGGQQSARDALMKRSERPEENWRKGLSVGGFDLPVATLRNSINNPRFKVAYKVTTVDGSQPVESGGTTPAATRFADDGWRSILFPWSRRMQPIEVREGTIQDALQEKGLNQLDESDPRYKATIAEPLEQATREAINVILNEKETHLSSGSPTLSEQTAATTPTIYGIRHLVSDGAAATSETAYRYVGGKDRQDADAAPLRSNVYLASAMVTAGDIPSTKVSLNLFKTVASTPNLGGVANTPIRAKARQAGSVVLLPSACWNTLRAETEGDHTIVHPGEKVPMWGYSIGFKGEILISGGHIFIADDSGASDEAFMLTPGTFVYQVRPGCNYALLPWVAEWKVQREGRYLRHTKLHIEDRLVLADFELNCKIKGIRK